MKRYKNIGLDYGVNTEYMDSFANGYEEEYEDSYEEGYNEEANLAIHNEEEAILSDIIEMDTDLS